MRDRHWASQTWNLIVIAMATGFLILRGVENHRLAVAHGIVNKVGEREQ
jgi:hypothetical protein